MQVDLNHRTGVLPVANLAGWCIKPDSTIHPNSPDWDSNPGLADLESAVLAAPLPGDMAYNIIRLF